MSGAAKPFLTVAIPVFNGARLLAPMLASLDAQDWSLFEVRFGDDGSTDGTPRVLEAFSARHPGRVFVDRHENIGPGPSRNRLIAQAVGEYVWFCDADDELAPGAIARIAEILRERPVDFLSFGYCARPDDPGKAKLDLAPVPVAPFELMQSMPCTTWAKVVNTSMLREGKIEFPPTRIGEDLFFSIRAACGAGSALFWYARPYWVRRRDDSVSGTVDEAFCAELRRSLELIRGLVPEHPAFKNAIEVQLLDSWNYFLRRLRNDAPAELRKRWIPVVKEALKELVSANDNPLLRLPRAYSRREGEALKREREALKREREALRRERVALENKRRILQRQEVILARLSATRKELACLRRSVSLRLGLVLTWPARGCVGIVRLMSGVVRRGRHP